MVKHCPSHGGWHYCPGEKIEEPSGEGLIHSGYTTKPNLSQFRPEASELLSSALNVFYVPFHEEELGLMTENMDSEGQQT